MKVGRPFRIETVHRRSGTETNRHGRAARQIEPTQTKSVIRFPEAIDALPNPFQNTEFHRRCECPSTQVLKYLAARCDTILFFEQSTDRCVHNLQLLRQTSGAVAHRRHLCTESGLGTIALVE